MDKDAKIRELLSVTWFWNAHTPITKNDFSAPFIEGSPYLQGMSDRFLTLSDIEWLMFDILEEEEEVADVL